MASGSPGGDCGGLGGGVRCHWDVVRGQKRSEMGSLDEVEVLLLLLLLLMLLLSQ